MESPLGDPKLVPIRHLRKRYLASPGSRLREYRLRWFRYLALTFVYFCQLHPQLGWLAGSEAWTGLAAILTEFGLPFQLELRTRTGRTYPTQVFLDLAGESVTLTTRGE